MLTDAVKTAGGHLFCLYPICLISLMNPGEFGAWPYLFIGICTVFSLLTMPKDGENDGCILLSWHLAVPLLAVGMLVAALLERGGAPADSVMILYGVTLFSLVLMGNVVAKVFVEARDIFEPRAASLKTWLTIGAMAGVSVGLAQLSAHLASV